MALSLSKLKLLRDYRQGREQLFPSEQALLWYERNHRLGLSQANALLKLRGRKWVDEDNFDAYVLSAAQACAQTQAGAHHVEKLYSARDGHCTPVRGASGASTSSTHTLTSASRLSMDSGDRPQPANQAHVHEEG